MPNSAPQPEARRENQSMPLQCRLAPVKSVNVESRTVDVVWTTGARVRRYDGWNERYYEEELSLDPAHVRMGRLQSGTASLLNTHNQWSLSSVMGVITAARLEAEQGVASVRFSKRADVEPYFQDVQDGILRNISVGYAIHKVERIAPAVEGGMWLYRIIDWEPYELSLVPIPADAGANTRSAAPNGADPHQGQRTWSCEFIDVAAPEVPPPTPAAAGIHTRKETAMPGENATTAAPTQAAPAANQQPDQQALAAARAEGARLENERQAGIREAVKLGGLDAAFADSLIANRDMTASDAGLAVLREQAKRSAADPTRSVADIKTVSDETENRRAAMTDAIVHRLNPAMKLADNARQFRHMSLLRMAEESLSAAGVSVRGLSGIEIAARAMHTTSDFPAILANVLNKRLRQAYEESARTYTRWARRAPNAPDFKTIQVTQLGGAPDLLKVNEAGEFKYGTIGDGKETYGVVTYGRIVAVSRQTIVNDDLRALDRLISAFGGSASRLENRLVYAQLTSNPAMNDSVALFDAAHGNVDGAAAIAIASLGAARAKMRLQKGLANEELNIVPAFLIVPSALEQVAYQYTSANYVPAKSADVNEFRAGGRTALEPIVEPVLDADSASKWYLAANSSQVDTVEYCYLDGSEGVWIESEIGFDVDGMKVKARLDFAAKAVDHRGLYRNG